MTAMITPPEQYTSREIVHGRAAEQKMIGDLLRHTQQGVGGVLLVDGEPGIGKSLLLRSATDEAADQGFSLAAGAADQLSQAIPFFALHTALRQPFVGLAGGNPGRDLADATAWRITQIRAHLERRAAAAPVLVCLDDLHWASKATLAALETLPRETKRHPVAWLLARSSTRGGAADYLFGKLEKDGAARVTLAPLDEDTVTAMLTDAFGAPPDQTLADFARGAAGNPSLVAELIGGLRDDHAVQVTGGRAVLALARLPQRIHRYAQRRLDDLGPRARHLLLTAAVLGPAFRLEDASEMLGLTPAMLLPALGEAMNAAMITATDHAFAFRHLVLCQAVGELIPQPGREALHRQYGHLLLSRGEPVQAARHLLQAVHPGDPTSLADLDAAVVQTSDSAPQTAADLALRVLELTPAAHPGALPRAVAAAEALASAGRLEQAARIARDRLAKPLPPITEGRLRCALSSVLCSRGQARDAAAEAEIVLALPELGPDLRDQAMTARLRALAELHDELAGPIAEAVLVDPSQHDNHLVGAALAARAVTSWDKGQVSEALELMRAAARLGPGVPPDARHGQPLLTLAAALIDLRQLGEAEDILHAASSQTMDRIPAQATLSVLRARIHLVRGQLADADAAAQRALATAEALGAHSHAAAAHRVLGLIALRRGDRAAAAHHIACQTEAMPPCASLYLRAETALVLAQICEPYDDLVAAVGHIRQASVDLMSHRGLLLGDPAAAAWLVRTALAAGDIELAAVVTHAAETLAVENPEYPVIAASAAHSVGLANHDPAHLAEAAGRHPDPWTKACAAEDLGVLHAQQAEKDHAIRQLTQAIEGYESTGAAADMARVRSRLRKLGVRRRHWTQSPRRPATGWESLTATEYTVSELAAEGLNNRQIAGRMYVSSSTVACYMRQIFRKLDLSSRVELARIVIQQSTTPPVEARILSAAREK
jgi:DNA-binding CsgD family transcriptional regulator/predicted negative regulator of RcsB-dependent stress response